MRTSVPKAVSHSRGDEMVSVRYERKALLQSDGVTKVYERDIGGMRSGAGNAEL